MKGAEGEAVRTARLQGQDDRVTYSHVIVIARRPQRRLGYDVSVARFVIRRFEPRRLDIARPAALWKTNLLATRQ